MAHRAHGYTVHVCITRVHMERVNAHTCTYVGYKRVAYMCHGIKRYVCVWSGPDSIIISSDQ